VVLERVNIDKCLVFFDNGGSAFLRWMAAIFVEKDGMNREFPIISLN
jgi:hypothetical protein